MSCLPFLATVGRFWQFFADFGRFFTVKVRQHVIYPPCMAQNNCNCVLCNNSAEMCTKCAEKCTNIKFCAKFGKHLRVFDPYFHLKELCSIKEWSMS